MQQPELPINSDHEVAMARDFYDLCRRDLQAAIERRDANPTVENMVDLAAELRFLKEADSILEFAVKGQLDRIRNTRREILHGSAA